MAFRDDQDAQLARADSLNRDLEQAKGNLRNAESKAAGLAAELEVANERAQNAERRAGEHAKTQEAARPGTATSNRAQQSAGSQPSAHNGTAIGLVIAGGIVLISLALFLLS